MLQEEVQSTAPGYSTSFITLAASRRDHQKIRTIAGGGPNMGQPWGSAAAKSLAKGIRDWELEEEQSAGGISIPLPSSWQAPGNRQARQTELAAGIYREPR